MPDVCREFGVSRKTGYKIFDRYKERGLEALTDRSRRPVRYANQLPQQIESLIVRLKAEKPHWGRARSASFWSDERIKPGHPQQNGRHERMHLTLKKEATRPPGFNSLQQQERFDAFVREFNTERPHQALDMKCPAELYTASARRYVGLPDLTYPF